jgi:tetratricopeptide (TPR) repeat protein
LARSTAFRFQEGELDLQALRRDLKLSSIATVGMTVQGQRLEMTIQLTSTEKGELLLTRQYSGTIDAPHTLAEQAGRDLLAVIHPASARKRRASTTRTAADPQAYLLLLKARFQWNKRTPEGFKQSIELYQHAIEIDPTFAAAYVGLADAYNFLGFFAMMPPRLVYPKAKAAAKRAIELDPSAGEAYASLGYTAGQHDWNFHEAIRLNGEAIQRNPSYAWAYQWRGLAGYMPDGQMEEALKSVRQAEELDPLSRIMNTAVGSVLLFARRYEEAREVLEHIREIEPKFMAVHAWLGLTYEQLGRYDEALASMMTSHSLAPGQITAAGLCHCYAVAGRGDEALKLLDETMQRSDRSYVTPYVPLMTYIGLGDEQRALESLKAAIEERSTWLYLARVDPRFDRLRDWMGSGLETLLNEHVLLP